MVSQSHQTDRNRPTSEAQQTETQNFHTQQRHHKSVGLELVQSLSGVCLESIWCCDRGINSQHSVDQLGLQSVLRAGYIKKGASSLTGRRSLCHITKLQLSIHHDVFFSCSSPHSHPMFKSFIGATPLIIPFYCLSSQGPNVHICHRCNPVIGHFISSLNRDYRAIK